MRLALLAVGAAVGILVVSAAAFIVGVLGTLWLAELLA